MIRVYDAAGNVIETHEHKGDFIGTKGRGRGQLAEPKGTAVDRAGNIYIAEVGDHRVQKLAPDGTFIGEWKGPKPGFYGPRRVAIGPDDSVYVVDQGHTRIVKFSPDGQVLAVWGSKGLATASSTTRPRSQLMPQPIKFMSPIHLTGGYRCLIQMGSF